MSETVQNVTSLPTPSVATRLKKFVPSKKTIALVGAGAATTAAAVAYYVRSHKDVQDAFVGELAEDLSNVTSYEIDVTNPNTES